MFLIRGFLPSVVAATRLTACELRVELVKKQDVSVEFQHNSKISISNFEFKTEVQQYQLLQNRLVSRSASRFQFLLEELKQFDYFLKVKDETDQIDVKEFLSLIKSIEVIDYAANLEPALIKARDNLIF